jgi:hypothetical protein
MSTLVERFYRVVLLAQVFVSLLNTLFTLADENAVIALFGFYGLHERRRSPLLMFLCFTAFGGCMDVVRILVYFEYINTVLLGFQVSLGYYYLMLISFGLGLKVFGIAFGYWLWKTIPQNTKYRPVEEGI